MGGGGESEEIRPATIEPQAITYPPQAPNLLLDSLFSYNKDIGPMSAWMYHKQARDYYQPFLSGNYNPQTMPGFAPAYDVLRGGLEGQYGQAKQNLLAGTPRGGAMTDALANLEFQRARDTGLGTSGLSEKIINNLWSGASNMGTGTVPQMMLSSMGQGAGINQSGINADQATKLGVQTVNAANALQAQQFNAQAAMQAGQMNNQSQGKSGLGALGSGVGSLLGLAMSPLSGTSMMGNAMSGITSGKGGTGGLGGYGIGAGGGSGLGFGMGGK